MHSSRVVFYTILTVMIMLAPARSWAGPASDHTAEFQSGLVSVMKDANSLGVKGRDERLEPLVKAAFHLPLMAGLSAGSYWNSATATQRDRLVQAFSRMSIATLATLFDGYSGEKFVVTGERPGPQGIMFVDTALQAPGRDSDVSISYVARQFNGDWRLIDVIVDGGISELRVRISEYRQTLKTGGIDALIRLLENKADDLLS